VGIKGSAVIATNPPIHPFNIWTTSVFPKFNLVTIAAAITPPAPAKNVLIKIVDTAIASSAVPIASCEPPLNPNQPNQRTNTPKVTNGIEDAANGFNGAGAPDLVNLPSLGPIIIAPANAAAPPVECTNVDQAKSEKPIEANQPPPHCQPITIGYIIPDKIAANKKNGHNLILSAMAPDTIDTVVAQNTI
jgi:hypothetical protein